MDALLQFSLFLQTIFKNGNVISAYAENDKNVSVEFAAQNILNAC